MSFRRAVFGLAAGICTAAAAHAQSPAPPARLEPSRPAAIEVRARTPAQAEALHLLILAENVGKGEISEHVRAWGLGLAAAQKAFPTPSAVVGEAMICYGRALAISGEVDKALEQQTRGLAILEAAPDKAKARYAMMLGFVGDSYRMKGENEIAEGYFQRSLAELKRLGRAETNEGSGALNALADLTMRRGKADLALDYQRSSLEISERILPVGDPDRILARTGFGNHLASAGRAREAEPQLRAAVEEASRLVPGHPATLSAMEALANFLREAGRTDEGLAIVEQTIAHRRAGKGSRDQLAFAYNIQGLLHLDRGDNAAAETAFLQGTAVVAQTAGPKSYHYARILHNAALAALAAEDDALAAERDREALEILTGPLKGQSPNLIAAIRTSLSSALYNRGQLAEAKVEADAAAQFSRDTLAPGDLTRIAAQTQLALTQAAAGDRTGGLARAQGEVAPIVERMKLRRALSGGLRTNLAAIDSTLGRVLETAWLAGDVETGFQTAQLLLETDLSRAAEALNARFAGGEGGLAEVLRRRQDLATEREGVDRAYLVALASKGPSAPALKAQVTALDERLTALDRRLDAEFPNYRALTEPLPVSVAEAQARLGRDEALVLVIQTSRKLFTLALRRDRVDWQAAPVSRLATRADIARMRAGLGGVAGARAAVDAAGEPTSSAASAFDTAAAWRVHQAIFGPRIRAAVGDARLYTLAANDAFTALPFSVLVTEDPAGSRRGPTPWLIRKAALRITPSIQGMAADQAASGGRSFVGIGAPNLRGAAAPTAAAGYFRGAGADLAAVKALPALPGAGRELESIARALGPKQARLMIGAAATEWAVKQTPLADARVVAFATHGLVAGDLAGLAEPALVLTPPDVASSDDDGLLTASEAALLKLDADWVILSACNTAAGDARGAPGYTGLARAFMFAGGRTVMASHWPVRDDTAARLTVAAVRGQARGRTPAEALRRAMLDLMDDPKVAGAADPSVWAPFMVIGR